VVELVDFLLEDLLAVLELALRLHQIGVQLLELLPAAVLDPVEYACRHCKQNAWHHTEDELATAPAVLACLDEFLLDLRKAHAGTIRIHEIHRPLERRPAQKQRGIAPARDPARGGGTDAGALADVVA